MGVGGSRRTSIPSTVNPKLTTSEAHVMGSRAIQQTGNWTMEKAPARHIID